MKSKWFTLGCLTSIVIIIIMIFTMFWTFGSIGKAFQKPIPERIVQGSWLRMDISGRITDYNEFENSPFAGSFSAEETSVHEIVHKINKAGQDDKIQGILLEPKFISCGYANLHEIMSTLENFKTTGKEIHAYLDFGMNKDYILSTVADKIYLNPSASAGILLTGVGGGMLFYKDLLEKIGVEINVIHAGKYKGAGETFTRNELSEPVRKNLDRLFSNVYDSILAKIAENRNIDISEITKVYENREELFINQNTALEYDLVDELSFKEDLYNKLGVTKKKLVSFSKYKMPNFKESKSNIAVIYAQGGIVMQSQGFDAVNITAAKLNKILTKIENDNEIKGVVIRVNSPGGSALVSEMILDRIKRLSRKKPVVISMGNVAASGGYYISAESDYIFADPFTITGSIGVVAMLPNISKLTDYIGIHEEDISKGKFSNAMSLYSQPDESMIRSLRMSIMDTYMEFKQRVADGRGMSLNDVELIAQGQVWSAEDALQNKLIDETGMISDAIKKAAELSNVEEFTIKYFPKHKNFFEEIIKDKFDVDITETLISNQIKEDKGILKAWQLLKSIKDDPLQAVMSFELEN
ncbi:MAG: signal peptide peptidase SppA [Candidatus Cloacimonetes bacterium]|jgi:protease-4|nr:signal peptide peptidase SppA [Candidatus Cloacimonadota bacterium]